MPKMGKAHAQNGDALGHFTQSTMPKMGKSLIYHPRRHSND